MARIVLIGALPQEIAAYQLVTGGVGKVVEPTGTRAAPKEPKLGDGARAARYGSWQASWHGHDVCVAPVGVGKAHAAANTTRLLLEHRADYCIFTGVAGALDERLSIGDIVLVEQAVDADLDVRVWKESEDAAPYQRGEFPFSRERWWYSDPDLVANVKDAYRANARIDPATTPRLVSGYVATGSAFLDAEGKKRFIAEVSPQLLCPTCGPPAIYDMESSAVLQAASLLSVPTVVIRAVSDTLSGDAPRDFNTFIGSAVEQNLALIDRLLQWDL